MKKRWARSLKFGRVGDCFDPTRLAPRKFCAHICECGGESMSSVNETEVTGFFNSPSDFLGFLRFVKIPEILDFDSETYRKPFPGIADSYLEKYDTDRRNQIDRLLGQIDKYLISGTVTMERLSIILDDLNATFLSTNPQFQVFAWGNIAETLTSPYFNESEEAISPELKELLDSDTFDENNKFHLELARSRFEAHFSA
jgi:hypothetical protein